SLDQGTTELGQGSAQIQQGLIAFASEGTRLTEGSSQISGGLSSVASGLTQLSGGSELYYNGINLALQGIEAQVGGVPDLAAASALLAQAEAGESALQAGCESGVEQISASIPDIMAAVVAGHLSPEEATAALQGALANYKTNAIDQLPLASNGVQQAQQYLDTALLYNSLAGLGDGYGSINAGLAQSASGLGLLAGEYRAFDSGVSAYVLGARTLAESYGSFDAGLAELSQGTALLHEGTLHLDEDLIEGLKEQFSSFLGTDYIPESFVDARNRNVAQVQFIFMVEGVPEPEAATEEPADTAGDDNVLTRLLALFGT
ncbi:MAG: hypothetical protein LBJ48_08125, partial [Coriobacteriales bacterium]|nr:hypothetical protein [Coriobacteriales bacterium]